MVLFEIRQKFKGLFLNELRVSFKNCKRSILVRLCLFRNRRCSENMQQIYKRTPMPKCDFNKVVLEFY